MNRDRGDRIWVHVIFVVAILSLSVAIVALMAGSLALSALLSLTTIGVLAMGVDAWNDVYGDG
jgi:hypothetical protein